MHFNCSALGHKALDYRSSFLDDREDFIKGFLVEDMQLVDSLAVTNELNDELPFIHTYAVNMPVETVGNKLLVSPFAGLVYRENPLKLSFRNYPVDMVYREKKVLLASIDIPEGYSFMDMNKKVDVENDLVAIHYAIEKKDKVVEVHGTYEFKKPVYQRHEYYDLKSFMSQIAETFNDRIVFVKD